MYSFENFITFEENMIAYNAAKNVAFMTRNAYNPLFIYGGPGTGKTHLLKAIENTLTINEPTLNVLYTTAEEFASDVIAALRSSDYYNMSMIREIYRSPDVILVDDFQFLIGNKEVLDEITHTIDILIKEGKQIVFSADKPPKKLKMDKEISYKLGQGLIVELQEPDIFMKRTLIQMKAKEHEVLLNDEVVEYISANIDSNVGEIEGAVISIAVYVEMYRPVISLATAKTILKDVVG